VKALVLGFVLLAATAAQAEDRKCIREMTKLFGDVNVAKRQCDPKNFVSDANEYGWVCTIGEGYSREKGTGAKKKEDAPCE
jgi:opacity protein-like surface antigen